MGRFTQECFKIIGSFAQECHTNGALRARVFNYGRFAQKWSEKSLVEGGRDIRGVGAADAHSSFNELFFRPNMVETGSCAKRPMIWPFLREAPPWGYFRKTPVARKIYFWRMNQDARTRISVHPSKIYFPNYSLYSESVCCNYVKPVFEIIGLKTQTLFLEHCYCPVFFP